MLNIHARHHPFSAGSFWKLIKILDLTVKCPQLMMFLMRFNHSPLFLMQFVVVSRK